VVDGILRWEAGKNRVLFPKNCVAGNIECIDSWKAETSPEEGYLYSSLFQDIFGRHSTPLSNAPLKSSSHSCLVKFVIRTANVDPEQEVFVCGSPLELGAWNVDNSKQLYYSKPNFIGEFVLPLSVFPIEFKFLIKNRDGSIDEWENGANRIIKGSNSNTTIYTSIFRKNNYNWRGTGVAVPVFSLRSNSGLGVGEFYDLKLLVDLCNQTGIKLIQILPINDTSCYGTWRDSYPYSGLSVFALHPMYLHIPAITDNDQIKTEAEQEANRLNELPVIDYEEVMNVKNRLMRDAFQVDGHSVLISPEFAEFMQDNKSWLIPYAVFKALSEQFKTTDYLKWPDEYQRVTMDQIEYYSQNHKEYCDFIYYVQYFLHVQLSEVSRYARAHHVGIKGDLPIGVNLRSVDSWLNPHLFNLSMSTGAPPDQFSTDGQNWGFPTYNWDEMKKDGYKWWRSRLGQMAKYFQAFRIDHILGFFRIWEIPRSNESGLMGHFYPSIPIQKMELESRNILDIDRLSVPFIPEDAIRGAFEDKAQYVMDVYLDRLPNGNFNFKPQYNTERKILDYIQSLRGSRPNDIDPNVLRDVFLLFYKKCLSYSTRRKWAKSFFIQESI
jgi:4-alpha-glucanotransferase